VRSLGLDFGDFFLDPALLDARKRIVLGFQEARGDSGHCS